MLLFFSLLLGICPIVIIYCHKSNVQIEDWTMLDCWSDSIFFLIFKWKIWLYTNMRMQVMAIRMSNSTHSHVLSFNDIIDELRSIKLVLGVEIQFCGYAWLHSLIVEVDKKPRALIWLFWITLQILLQFMKLFSYIVVVVIYYSPFGESHPTVAMHRVQHVD